MTKYKVIQTSGIHKNVNEGERSNLYDVNQKGKKNPDYCTL